MRGVRGQTLVEFLMVFTIFLAIFAFAIEIAQLNMVRSMLNVATYSAARKFAVTQNLEVATAAAEFYLEKVAEEGSIRVDTSDEQPAFGSVFLMGVTMKTPLLLLPYTAQFFGATTHGYREVFSEETVPIRGTLVNGEPRPVTPTREDLHLTPNQTFQVNSWKYIGYLKYRFKIWVREEVTSDLDEPDYPSEYSFYCETGPLDPDHQPKPTDCSSDYKDYRSGLFGVHPHHFWVDKFEKIPWGSPWYEYSVTVITDIPVEETDDTITLSKELAMSADGKTEEE